MSSKITLSKNYIDKFLKSIISRHEQYTKKNYTSHQESDTNFEATAILSTNDPVTKDLLNEKLSSYVNTYAIESTSKSPEGQTVLFDIQTPFGLGQSRIKKLEANFKDPYNHTWLVIKDPESFQKRLPVTLEYEEMSSTINIGINSNIESVYKGNKQMDDERISINDLKSITLHVFQDSIQNLKDQENKFTKRSKKFHRDKLYKLLEGKEQEISMIFFQCLHATQEQTESQDERGFMPLSFLINNFIHQIYFDVLDLKSFERDQMEHFLRQLIENFLKPYPFDENQIRITDNKKPKFYEPYFILDKNKPMNLQDKDTIVYDQNILLFRFNNKLLCEDHFYTWDRHQILPQSIPPKNWDLTKNKKIKLGNKIQPIPKISQMPCSNTHISDIQVETCNYQQSQRFYVNKDFLKALVKNENWRWILEEENNSIGWPHIPSTTMISIFEEARKRNLVIRKNDLKPQAIYIHSLNKKFKQNKITQYLLSLFARQDIPMYFQESLDFRGRSSPKGMFTPLNNKLVRHALLYSFDKKLTLNQTGMKYLCGQVHAILGGEKEVNYDEIYERITSTYDKEQFNLNDLKKYLRSHKDKVKTKHKLDYLSIRNRNPSEQIIFMDASSSGSQILAMIINSKNLAMVTNTFKDSSNNKAYDPYTRMVKDTKNQYPRALLKDFIMTSSQNAGKRSLIIKIVEHINCTFQEGKEIYNDIQIQYMKQIKPATVFIEYLQQKDLKEDSEKIFAQNIDLPLINLKQGYCEYKDLRVSFYPKKNSESKSEPKRCRFNLKSPMYLKGSDLLRMKRAQAANLVQALDATLKVYLLSEFQQKELPITCQHDAFGTHPNQAPELIKAYNKGLIEIAKYQQQDFEGFNNWLPQYCIKEIEILNKKITKDTQDLIEVEIILYQNLLNYKLKAFNEEEILQVKEAEFSLNPFLCTKKSILISNLEILGF